MASSSQEVTINLVPIEKCFDFAAKNSNFSVRGFVDSITGPGPSNEYVMTLSEADDAATRHDGAGKTKMSGVDTVSVVCQSSWKGVLDKVHTAVLVQVDNPSILLTETKAGHFVSTLLLGEMASAQHPRVVLLNKYERPILAFTQEQGCYFGIELMKQFEDIKVPWYNDLTDSFYYLKFNERHSSPTTYDTVRQIVCRSDREIYTRVSLFAIVLDARATFQTKGPDLMSHITVVDETSYYEENNESVKILIGSFFDKEEHCVPFRGFGDVVRVDRAQLVIYNQSPSPGSTSSRQVFLKNYSACVMWPWESESFRPIGVRAVYTKQISNARKMLQKNFSVTFQDCKRVEVLREFARQKLIPNALVHNFSGVDIQTLKPKVYQAHESETFNLVCWILKDCNSGTRHDVSRNGGPVYLLSDHNERIISPETTLRVCATNELCSLEQFCPCISRKVAFPVRVLLKDVYLLENSAQNASNTFLLRRCSFSTSTIFFLPCV